MISLSAPDTASIVGCWFPYDETTPPKPGEKFRPCLVLSIIKKIESKEILLAVCYGTGQTSLVNKGLPSSWEIEIESRNNNNLTETTRFNLKKFVILPLIDDFFRHSRSNLPFSLMGRLIQDDIDLVIQKLKNNKIEIEKPKVINVKHIKKIVI